MSKQAEENYKKFKDKIYKGNKGSRRQELIDFADLHHKEQLEKFIIKLTNQSKISIKLGTELLDSLKQ